MVKVIQLDQCWEQIPKQLSGQAEMIQSKYYLDDDEDSINGIYLDKKKKKNRYLCITISKNVDNYNFFFFIVFLQYITNIVGS